MRFGPRRPSWRKSFAARTSWKRRARASFGLRAPRGWGWLTNPKKAVYNRVYSRTTFSLLRRRRSHAQGCMVPIAIVTAGLGAAAVVVLV